MSICEAVITDNVGQQRSGVCQMLQFFQKELTIMKVRKPFAVLVLIIFLLVVGTVIAYSTGEITNKKNLNSTTTSIITEANEKGRLVLPIEGLIIKGRLVDLEEYTRAATQEDKNEILEKLLNDPNNKIINTEKRTPPSKGGEAVAFIDD